MRKMENEQKVYNLEEHKRQRNEQKMRPIHLHLELRDEYLDEEECLALKTYGRSSDGNGIIRDILIPPDMPLHNLHYAIQKLYGWQNSHLHAFRLPEDVYKNLTGNTVRGWGNLVGTLFQTVYPEDVWQERYGDDNYASGKFNHWLKKKYTGPYTYLGKYEIYKRALHEFHAFVEEYSNLAVREHFDINKIKAYEKIHGKGSYMISVIKYAPVIELTIDEMYDSVYMESGTEDLLERLRVSEVLSCVGEGTVKADKIGKRMMRRTYEKYGEVPEPVIKPVTNKLIYNYDYGDNWMVEITRLKDCADLLDSGVLTSEELMKAEAVVKDKYKPVCIFQEGIGVMDDVGGLSGFVNLLKIIYESDDEVEREHYKAWAEGMGWSTRRINNGIYL